MEPGRSAALISATQKLSKMLNRDLRRRAAIEPKLGHMNSDGFLGRNFLEGVAGRAQNVIPCGARHKMRMILAHLWAPSRLLLGDPRRVVEAIIALLEAGSIPQQVIKAA